MKKALIVESELKLVAKLKEALKPKYDVEFNLHPIDLKYYDLVFVSLNILKSRKNEFLNLDNLVCLTNIDSKVLRSQMALDFKNLRYLKYEFSDDELYRVLNNYTLIEEYTDIIEHLKELGVKANIKGFIYLVEIVNSALVDIKNVGSIMESYQTVADKYQVSLTRVERDIRYLVGKYNQKMGTIYTNSDFIFKIVNDLLIKKQEVEE